MSEQILIKDLQKLEPGSELVELFEIEYSAGVFAYFTSFQDNTTALQFRDYLANGTIRTYTQIPITASGFEKKVQGSAPRPTLTIANVENTLSSAVGDIDYTKLLGLKVIRRTTLKKYLYGESGDSSPPIEYPREVFFIDRMTERTKVSVKFELASPFDLQGVTLPRRNVIANRCPWIYQGAGGHLDETSPPQTYKKAQSGCSWHLEGKFKAPNSGFLADGVTPREYTFYVNQDDAYLVPTGNASNPITATTYSNSLTGIDPNEYLKSNHGSALTRLNPDGTTTSNTPLDYWQVKVSAGENQTGAQLGVPSDTNTKVSRVVPYTLWAADTDYHTFAENDLFNSYVIHTDDVSTSPTYQKTLIWKARKPSRNIKPAHGDFWERGDICSKSLTGCKKRFGARPITEGSSSSTATTEPLTNVVLPFGGFPGAKGIS